MASASLFSYATEPAISLAEKLIKFVIINKFLNIIHKHKIIIIQTHIRLIQ
jgi:hypothetical protein